MTAFAASLHTTRAGDLFWQIRVGHDILASGHPPFHDTYSWTRYGQPWVVNEWLSFILLFEAFQWTQGFGGPFLLMEIMILGIVICLYFFLSRLTGSPVKTFVLALLCVVACTYEWQPRPFIFTDLFLIVTVGLVSQARQGQSPVWTLWLLPPLFLLWANLHQGVTVGAGFVVVLALTDVAGYVWFTLKSLPASALASKTKALHFGLLSVCCFGASLITPYGLGLYKMILVTIQDQKAMAVVLEWRPLQLTFSWPDACLLMLAALLTAGLVRYRGTARSGEILFVLLLSYEAVAHRRNLPLAVLAGTVLAAPLLARALGDLAQGWIRLMNGINVSRRVGTRPRAFPITLAGAFSLLLSMAYVVGMMSTHGIQSGDPLGGLARMCFGTDRFPDEACSFIEYEHFPTGLRLYNDFNIGGFLIWRCPEQRVFTDGRIDVYAGPLLDGALSVDDPQPNQVDLTEGNKNFLRSYRFDCVITANALTAKFFAQQPDWSLVYVHHRAPVLDRSRLNAWIFVRHRPDLEALIARSRSDWAAHNQGVPPDANL